MPLRLRKATSTVRSGCCGSPEAIPSATFQTILQTHLYPNRRVEFRPHNCCLLVEQAQEICCRANGNGTAPRAVPGPCSRNTRPKGKASENWFGLLPQPHLKPKAKPGIPLRRRVFPPPRGSEVDAN